jgi:phage shock protein E
MTLAILGVLAACDRSSPPAPSAQTQTGVSSATTPSGGTVDGAKARKLVSEGAKLVDVRGASEYAEKHVDGAENVPVDTVAERDLGPKDKAIVVYCHSGKRSARAATTLRSRGYTHVYDLGGMSSWYE